MRAGQPDPFAAEPGATHPLPTTAVAMANHEPAEGEYMLVRKAFVLVSLLTFLCGVCAVGRAAEEQSAQPPQANTARDSTLSPQQMRSDLAFLRGKILAQHPHPFLYVPSDEFERLYRDTFGNLDKPLDRVEFYRRAARIAASLKDGHTLVDLRLDAFAEFAKSHGVFPLEAVFVGPSLYVGTNASGDERLKPGTEIVAINGMPVASIVNGYRSLIDDVHPLYDLYARLFRELFWLRYGAPENFAIEFRGGDGKTGTAQVPAHVFAANEFHSYVPAGETFSFKMLPAAKAGLLTINSFAPSADFDAFLEQTFAALQVERVPALIIDIRKNGGGSGRLAQQLVSYLTDRPYKLIGAFYVKVTDDLKALYAQGTTHTDEDTRKIVMGNPAGTLVDGLRDSGPVVVTPPRREHRFRGAVYVLTANNTFSAAAMFASYVKCNQLGKLVGEEPGQATNFVADAVPFTMPNSGLSFGVSFSEIHMACEQGYYHGIRPDYPLSASPAGIAQGKDAVLDFAVGLIDSH